MKRLTATVIGAFAFLIFAVSPAHALKAIVATIALGEVQVIGIQAKKNATIKWEDNEVTHSNKLGAFLFSTTNLPIDCVGKLSDGFSTIDVVIHGCTTQQVIGGGVPKTGQTASDAPGDDGDLQKGLSTSPRFTNNGNGTITDNLTGLIWLKNANCFGTRQWATAISDANTLASGACGLTDGSGAGDWRLPNLRELQSLVDYGTITCCITIIPALPSGGHPFTNFQASFYWSSTTHFLDSTFAWGVGFSDGFLENLLKAVDFEFDTLVLAVRGGS